MFCACQVDMEHVFRVAHRLAEENKVWERNEGLARIWGRMIETWLNLVLPDNAANLCSGRVAVSVRILKSPLYSDFTCLLYASSSPYTFSKVRYVVTLHA